MEQLNSTTNKYIYIFIALTGLVIVVAGWFYYEKVYNVSYDMNKFKASYDNAGDLYNSRNYNEAINEFSKLLNNPPDKEYEGKIRILLAGMYYSRNQANDRTVSIRMYKDIISDSTMSPSVKAKVYTDLASIVIHQSENFYKIHFSEPPFDSFLPSIGSARYKMANAYFKFLELSDKTFPNSNAKYQIGGNYYSMLLVNNELGNIPPEEVAGYMQSYIKDADKIDDESTYNTPTLLQRYLYRATGLNASNRVLNNLSLGEREEAFKLVLTKGDQFREENDFRSVLILMKGRFYYANFLMEYYGESRYDDIVELLKPFGEAASSTNPMYSGTRSNYAYIANPSESDYIKERSLRLGSISPEFKNFLLSLSVEI